MPNISLYGLECSPNDEREIMRRINASLDKIKRTTSKATQKSLLDARKPFTLKHFFWNLHRDAGVYFEVLQNQDLKGKWHRPDHQDKGLLLTFSLQPHAFRDGVPLKKPLQYIERVLRAVKVPYEKIAEGDEFKDIFPARSAPKKASGKASVPKKSPTEPAAAKKARARVSPSKNKSTKR
jgi:hypothetical protein